jgi:hypothetical protein
MRNWSGSRSKVINVRGLGSMVKRRKIREVVQTKCFDFWEIQERKMESIPDSFVNSLWGSSDCGWAFSSSGG